MKARKYLLPCGIGLLAALAVFTATSPSIAQDVARIRTEIRQELHKLGLIDSPGGTNAAALGPSSSVDSYVSVFSGTTGKLLDDRPVTVASTGQVSWPTGLGNFAHVSGPTDQHLRIRAGAGRALILGFAGSDTWQITTNGEFGPGADNSRDLGTSGARVRSGYFGTSVVVGTADTSGTLLKLESGDLSVREGDDSASASFRADTVTATRTRLGAGSAAAPAHSFSGDPDSGFYTYAANVPGVSYGGVGATLPGVLTKSVTSASTTAVTTEETLWSYSLPAGTLASRGQAVRIRVFGSTANNANSKTIRLKWGASSVRDISTSTTGGIGWRYDCTIMRSGAAAQVIDCALQIGSSPGTYFALSGTETLSGAVTIALTGQNGTANAGDITFLGAIVEFLP